MIKLIMMHNSSQFRNLKLNGIAFVLVVLAMLTPVVLISPSLAIAQTGATSSTGSCNPGKGGVSTAIFTPWYKYLKGEKEGDSCSPTFPKTSKGNYDVGKGVTLVVVAIIELLIHVSGIVAAGFIIWGAIQYIISQGNPGKDGQGGIAGAKSTITNAIVGLVIIVVASAGVQFIGSVIK